MYVTVLCVLEEIFESTAFGTDVVLFDHFWQWALWNPKTCLVSLMGQFVRSSKNEKQMFGLVWMADV